MSISPVHDIDAIHAFYHWCRGFTGCQDIEDDKQAIATIKERLCKINSYAFVGKSFVKAVHFVRSENLEHE